ncbi:MAG: putative porin [Prevotellaceae bacterium]|nr:putative porin [Prevotellaceae bacterium]
MLLFVGVGVNAQTRKLRVPNGSTGTPPIVNVNDNKKGENIDSNEPTPQDTSPSSDTTVILKTLDTYLFGDWHKTTYVFSWKHNPYFNTVDKRLAVDTSINNNVFDYPFFKNDVGATFLGNSGGAALTHDYSKRHSSKGFIFFTPYSDYIYTRENIPSYNTKGPFSMLTYVTSGKKQISEDNLKVLLTQNVTPELNLGLYYQRYGTRGVYQNQGTDNRVFTFYTSYAGKRYSAHAGYIHNRVSNEENGGIRKDADLEDPDKDLQIIDVNLSTAGNRLRSNGYFLTHSYGVPLHIFKRSDSLRTGEGTMVYFGHAFQYLRQYRIYTDEIRGEEEKKYYDNYFINPTKSRDSSFTSSLDNRLFIRLQPWSPTAIVSTIDGGVGLEHSKYCGFSPNQFLYGTSDDTYTDLYLYARAAGVFSKYFAWNAFGQYVISGYRQNDFLLDASARISVYPFSRQLNLEGRLILENTEPDYFQQRYYSNHFKWNNTFGKTTNTRIEVALSVPDYMFELGLKQSIVSNLVYVNTTPEPAQESGTISITSLYVRKNFKAGAFHADNRFFFQISGNEDVVPLPKISLNARWYAQFVLVKSVLTGQLGLDTYFHTKYYVPAYNPAIGLFHNQNEKKIGNYPMVDAFVNFKWKRATINVKFTHVDQGMFNKEYFSALHYPRNKRMLRIGVTWHFYN